MQVKRGDAALLLFYLDQAFGRRGWHGPTLSALVRNVGVAEAMWRPSPGRHSVWELVLHAAFWKNTVRRRITGDGSVRFPRSPANWPKTPEGPTARAWLDDVELLKAEHRKLVRTVSQFPAARLFRKVGTTRFIPADQIAGIAAHDLYHAGQIAMIRKLWAGR